VCIFLFTHGQFPISLTSNEFREAALAKPGKSLSVSKLYRWHSLQLHSWIWRHGVMHKIMSDGQQHHILKIPKSYIKVSSWPSSDHALYTAMQSIHRLQNMNQSLRLALITPTLQNSSFALEVPSNVNSSY